MQTFLVGFSDLEFKLNFGGCVSNKILEDESEVINNALINGGSFYSKGVKIFVDKPNSGNVGVKSGFWIRNGCGHTCYFNTSDRRKAQEACNDVFGKGQYTVNTPKN